ncbi:serine/threonine kinase-like domain-containing protein STKLD1 [Exaiptasia diaphana]|uniref:Serine/threonine kinase-like domain-containing protein STKLD1 n=1 Tax=Exaiptasia diaphana TaxID=2652724 RepID=A0A913Y5M2_EXADI|nr:serine/threonine kinase-like domain-containing protein STKLD1 [Exaiptasia diaphana]KXJ19701.1 Serine/threonine kinase-like domain-containing protein STKLD1 [Exaiptasia diaphana]
MENYKLHQRLGKGAQGAVFLVENKHDKKKYVLKKVECNDESEANKAFKEAMALQELKHPYTCGYKEFFVTWDKEESAMFVCIVMKYYKLGDLDKALKQRRSKGEAIGEMVLKKWFGQTISALVFVHDKQVIHRDLKPSNIFMEDTGDVIIGDFGVATIMDDARTRTRTTVGTMNWMAPEVLERPYDERSDVWSLGCIFLEMATCGFMDSAQMSSVLFQIKQSPQILEETLEQIKNKQKYSSDLCQLIRTMLRRNFQQRPSAKELLDLPYVKSCMALQDKKSKIGSGSAKKGAPTDKKKASVKAVPKDKGVAGVLQYMKENKETEACQVEAFKHIEKITREQGVSLNGATQKSVAATMKSNIGCQKIQIYGCKIFVNILPNADESEVVFTADVIQPVVLALRSHSGSSELQTNACQLLMLLSADEAAAEVIGRLGGVQDVLASMRAFPDNVEIASNCCAALWSLAVNENNCKIVTTERGLQDVCNAMERHSNVVELVEAACSALWSLSMEDENIELMADLSVPDQLMSSIVEHKKEAKVVKNACMALASIVEADEMCAYKVIAFEDNTGLQIIMDSYKGLKQNEEVVENICVLFSELVEYDEIREEMASLKVHTVLAEAKMNFPTNEEIVTPAASALVMLGGGSRSGRRGSSARSRPRSAARK